MAGGLKIGESCLTDRDVVRSARRVTWLGLWVNSILGTGKVIAGIFVLQQCWLMAYIHFQILSLI